MSTHSESKPPKHRKAQDNYYVGLKKRKRKKDRKKKRKKERKKEKYERKNERKKEAQ